MENVFDSLCVMMRRRSINKPPIPRKRCLFRSEDLSLSHHRDCKAKDQLELINSIPCSKLLGSGGFGSVYLGKMGTTKVAVKRLHRCTKNIKARNESFRAETRILKLSHPNVVRTLAAGGDETSDCAEPVIVMEYAGDKNLLHVINDASETLNMSRRLNFAVDIASALKYIHQNCVVHLDLKPANIIINQWNVCKLGDFGCSQLLEHGTGVVSPTKRSHLTGTLAYQAPELLRGQAPSTKADVYAFGITLWQMSFREQPYAGQDLHAAVFAIVSNHLRPRVPSTDSDTDSDTDTVEGFYRDLFCQCWEPQADDRPTSDDLVDVLAIWKSNLFDPADDNFSDFHCSGRDVQ